MRSRLKLWYMIEHTLYTHWPAVEYNGQMIPAHTTWKIVSTYTQSIRKANKLMKELESPRMSLVYR